MSIRFRSLLAPLALALLCSCERGCAKSFIHTRGAKGTTPASRASGSFPLSGMDCPDGLARCVDGRVQASRLFSYPAHCSGPPEQCSCPWDNLGSCKRGCVVEGADVVVARDHAWAQLCSPTAADVFSRPPIAPPELPISLCSEATYRCTGDVVVACEMDGATMKPRPLAACLRGCAEDGSAIDDDEGISRDAAIALLCRHGTEAPE